MLGCACLSQTVCNFISDLNLHFQIFWRINQRKLFDDYWKFILNVTFDNIFLCLLGYFYLGRILSIKI